MVILFLRFCHKYLIVLFRFAVILSQEFWKYFSVSFGNTSRIQCKFCLHVCYVEYVCPVHMIRQYILHVTKHEMKSFL